VSHGSQSRCAAIFVGSFCPPTARSLPVALRDLGMSRWQL
jgi:hypothetical protein